MHAYGSVAGVPPGISGDRHVYDTEEGQRNLKMAGGRGCLFTVYDATQILGADRRLHSTLSPGLIRRRMKAMLRRRIQSQSP